MGRGVLGGSSGSGVDPTSCSLAGSGPVCAPLRTPRALVGPTVLARGGHSCHHVCVPCPWRPWACSSFLFPAACLPRSSWNWVLLPCLAGTGFPGHILRESDLASSPETLTGPRALTKSLRNSTKTGPLTPLQPCHLLWEGASLFPGASTPGTPWNSSLRPPCGSGPGTRCRGALGDGSTVGRFSRDPEAEG